MRVNIKMIKNVDMGILNYIRQYKWANGNIFRGNFENDLRHGYGEIYRIDGTYQGGIWMNGVFCGEIKDQLP